MLSACLSRLGCAAALALGLTAPAIAVPVKANAEYAVTLGGTHVATVDVTLDDDGSKYELGLDARITGLARLVAMGTAKLHSTGASTGSGLKSQKFDLLTRAGGEDFTVAITYGGGNVNSFVVDPPVINNIDRVAIERRQLVGGINDMAAAFIIKGGQLDQNLCDRQMQIFTGVERFNLTLHYAKDDVATSKRTGYQGPVVLCSVHYTPISGHYTTSDITTYLQGNEHILLWYAPLATPGYFIPYRALIATDAGDLSIVLTSLKQ